MCQLLLFQKRTRSIIPDEIMKVRWAYEQRAKGMSLLKIIETMNAMGWRTREGKLWQQAVMSRMLRKPAYKGVTYAYRNVYEHVHTGEKKIKRYSKDRREILLDDTGAVTPPAVSKELWRLVNSLMDVAKERSARNLDNYEYFTLAGGYIRCAYCHGAIVVRHAGKTNIHPH